MASEFWDARFGRDEFFYGREPNVFIREHVQLPVPSRILELGTGEGRNAVYLATLGHAVTAVDFSSEGLRKLQRLADEAGVEVETVHTDVLAWTPDRQFDAVVTTFLHLEQSDRPRLFTLITKALRPGGMLYAEWFAPEQALKGYASGGPPRADMMVSLNELRRHFAADGERLGEELVDELDEGKHFGPAALTRFIWQKPA